MAPILKISRPRFWMYLFGPYLIGVTAAATTTDDFLRFDSILFAVYFLLPANLLVYGINDIFDFETDSVNPKKAGYETLVGPDLRRTLLVWIAILNIPFLAAAVAFAPHALLPLGAFLFFSIFYSAPPIRAKAIPIVDSLFNILYVVPGAFAYQMITGSFPPLWTIVAAAAWTAAMHAYSAIPDIKADTAAGVSTIATLLGKSWTHGFCIGCFCIATILAAGNSFAASPAGLVYVVLMRWSDTTRTDSQLLRVYRIFPWINAAVGFLIFVAIAWKKFL